MPIGKLSQEEAAEARLRAHKKYEEERGDFISKVPDSFRNYFLGLPDRHKKLLLRCYTGKSTPSQRIKAKCLDCSAYDKKEITLCTVKTCPLWIDRPYQKKDD